MLSHWVPEWYMGGYPSSHPPDPARFGKGFLPVRQETRGPRRTNRCCEGPHGLATVGACLSAISLMGERSHPSKREPYSGPSAQRSYRKPVGT